MAKVEAIALEDVAAVVTNLLQWLFAVTDGGESGEETEGDGGIYAMLSIYELGVHEGQLCRVVDRLYALLV